ncbi:MAG: YraN family protein [Parvibaculum sp.]
MAPPRGRQTRGQQAHRLGHRAEWLACLWLLLKGYRIRARRYKTHAGEIDIIASRGGLIAFVEVKARPDHHAALEALSPRQQQRLLRAAALYMATRRADADLIWRFDMILITPWRWPRHIADAWRA